MKLRLIVVAVLAGSGCAAPTVAAVAARVIPDLQPPQKRQGSIATAERLVKRPAPEPLESGLVSPFSPPAFDRPEPGTGPAVAQSSSRGNAGGQPLTPAPLTVRQTLENLAAQITPSGTVTPPRGGLRLVIGAKLFEVGTRFTATFNNQDYELELIAIDRTTFTLRYRGEEITRPIKPVR